MSRTSIAWFICSICRYAFGLPLSLWARANASNSGSEAVGNHSLTSSSSPSPPRRARAPAPTRPSVGPRESRAPKGTAATSRTRRAQPHDPDATPEQQTHGATFRDAHHSCPRRAGGVHDCPDIIDTCLEIGDSDRVRCAGAALVEQDQPTPLRNRIEIPGTRGVLPDQIDMGHRPRHVHQVEGPSPTTWYAIRTSPLFAYRVTGGTLGV